MPTFHVNALDGLIHVHDCPVHGTCFWDQNSTILKDLWRADAISMLTHQWEGQTLTSNAAIATHRAMIANASSAKERVKSGG